MKQWWFIRVWKSRLIGRPWSDEMKISWDEDGRRQGGLTIRWTRGDEGQVSSYRDGTGHDGGNIGQMLAKVRAAVEIAANPDEVELLLNGLGGDDRSEDAVNQ